MTARLDAAKGGRAGGSKGWPGQAGQGRWRRCRPLRRLGIMAGASARAAEATTPLCLNRGQGSKQAAMESAVKGVTAAVRADEQSGRRAWCLDLEAYGLELTNIYAKHGPVAIKNHVISSRNPITKKELVV